MRRPSCHFRGVPTLLTSGGAAPPEGGDGAVKLDFRARTASRHRTDELDLAPASGAADGGPAVVFDIDGVLSDAAGRQHFIERGRRDWPAFFEACGDDPVSRRSPGCSSCSTPRSHVILLTGRPQRVQPQTLAWLERYGLRWDLLVMRSRGDYAQVTSFKQSVVEDLRAYGFDLRLAFEDDPSNHAMYVAAGVPCVYIHSGYYE